MMKYCLGIAKMDKKIYLITSLLIMFGVTGCYSINQQPPAPLATTAEVDPNFEKNPPLSNTPRDDEFVNYTKVAADYKEYGERTPRDPRVVQSGAGSNVSSSVPPTIEEEVVEYEEEVQGGEAPVGDDSDQASAEDPVEDWLAEEGKSLKTLLTEWSDKAGWRLVWNSNRNYTLTAGAMFRGRFADVSSALIRAFARARPAPVATFYKGNRVLVVETMEDENAYE